MGHTYLFKVMCLTTDSILCSFNTITIRKVSKWKAYSGQRHIPCNFYNFRKLQKSTFLWFETEREVNPEQSFTNRNLSLTADESTEREEQEAGVVLEQQLPSSQELWEDTGRRQCPAS